MGLTVKGVPMNSSQQSTANALLAEGAKLQAGAIASQAIILAAIYENSISLGTYGGRIGPLSPLIGAQDSTGVPYAIGQSGIVQQAHDFFVGGGAFSSAITKARTTSDIVVVAEFAEGAEGQYETEAFPLSSGIAEAKAIVAAYDGGTATAGGVAGLGGTGTAADGSPSSTYSFVIGTTANPGEDYWTGVNRLAQEVNWYLFTDGELVYYMDGNELIGQQPALYLDRVGNADRITHLELTWDNTAFEYVSDHKRRFHVQRKTKLTTITSPTEGTLDLICGIDEVHGGDVIVLSSCGPGNGAWLIGDCTRSVFSVTSQLTLVPPIAPLSEIAVAGTTGTSKNTTIVTNGSTITGPIRQKILQIAQQAAALKAANYSTYMYDNQGDRFNYGRGVLAGPYPRTFDCSGFVTSCYRDAGAPDPGGSNYDNSETSDTIAAHCTQISASSAIPGDLVVFPEPHGHVVIYTGNGNCISQGGDSGPDVATVAAEAAYPSSAPRGIEGYYRCPGLL
jgi:hypothetical protein